MFQTTKAFLPSMMTRDHGHIVTIASSAGSFGVVGTCSRDVTNGAGHMSITSGASNVEKGSVS